MKIIDDKAKGLPEIIPFQFENQSVRVIRDEHGEPWFIARDVAVLLGYSNTSKAVNDHCKAVKTCPNEMGGQVRHVQIIPERDVYRLIMRSKLPAAEKFEEWVVGEVLPSIRKTGQYGGASLDLEDPAFLRATLLDYTGKVLARSVLTMRRLCGTIRMLAAKSATGSSSPFQNSRRPNRTPPESCGFFIMGSGVTEHLRVRRDLLRGPASPFRLTRPSSSGQSGSIQTVGASL